MVLFRQELGDVLRALRTERGLTLREVASASSVSLGYLSELERGSKEASSELLNSVCVGLSTPLSQVLTLVAERVEAHEAGVGAPLAVPVRLPIPRTEPIAQTPAA